MNDYKDFGIDMDELDRLLAEYGGGTEKKDTQPVEPKPEPVIPEYEKSEPEPEQEAEFKYEPEPESDSEPELENESYESETESEPYVSEDEEAESELESESFESEYEEPAYKYEPDYDDEDDDYDEPTPSKSKIQLRGTASKIGALSEGTGSIYAAPKTTKIDRTKLLQARLAQSEKEKKEAEASSKVGEDQSKAGTVGSKSGSEGRIRRASKSEKSIGKKPKSEKHISRKPKSLVNVKEREEKAEPVDKSLRGFWNRNWSWLIAAGVTAVFMLIFMIVASVAPFGSNSFTMIDSMHQYVPFFSVYQEKLRHFGSLSYTWNVGGGQNFQSLLLYYMASPLNLIIVFFTRRGIIAAMSLLVAIKIIFSAGAFSFFLSRRRNKISNSLIISGFGVAYALNNYMAGYFWNLMWLDCIMVFPLIILGFERLMTKHDFRLYTLALFYSLFCNYYISFIICVFLILWFFASRHGNVKEDGAVKAYFKGLIPDGLRFAGASLLAAGMACFSLLVAYLAITKTASAKLSIPKFEFYGSFMDILKTQFMLTKPINNQTFDGGVNLYCGSFAIVLFFLYVISGKIEITEKIRKCVLLIFLYISFNNKLLNYIWHGFHDQFGIPNRFSFLFIFTLLLVGYEAVTRMKKLHMLQAAVAGIMALMMLCLAYYFTGMSSYAPKAVVLTVSFFMIIVYTVILIARIYLTDSYRLTTIILGIMMMVEIVVNAGIGMGINGVADGEHHLKYTYATRRAKEAMDKYAEGKGYDFYREDMVETVMLDESTYNNMRSLATFCSTVRGNMVTAMGGLGFYTGANEYLYNGATPMTDDMLGVRFIYSRDSAYYPESERLPLVCEEEGIRVYENEDALPLGYAVNRTLNGWESRGPLVADNLNRFAKLSSDTGEIFNSVKPGYTIAGSGCTVGISSSNEELVTYEVTDSGAMVIYVDFDIETAGRYFINVRGNSMDKIALLINDELQSDKRSHIQMLDLGNRESGDHISLEIKFTSSVSSEGSISLYLSKMDEEMLKELNNRLSANGMTVTKFKDGYVKGNITLVDGQILMTTIPYDEGWIVKDNGKKIETKMVGGAFLGVDPGPGEHELTFKFVPQGMKMGLVVSIISWIIFFILYIVIYRDNRLTVSRK